MNQYFRVSIAEKNIEIECHNRTVFKKCRDYLNDFDTPDIRVSTTIEELEESVSHLPPIDESYEGVATTRFYGEAESLIVCKKISEKMLLFNTFLMHGAVVALNNYAYMFTAPSGTGKSTRIKLWKELYPESIVVNGDKPFIHIDNKQVIAYGSPWSGKEGWDTNIGVPLQAIFILERVEEGEASSIRKIDTGKAFPTLFRQSYHPENPELMRKTLFLLKELEEKVCIYKFRSELAPEAIELAYNMAKPQSILDNC